MTLIKRTVLASLLIASAPFNQEANAMKHILIGSSALGVSYLVAKNIAQCCESPDSLLNDAQKLVAHVTSNYFFKLLHPEEEKTISTICNEKLNSPQELAHAKKIYQGLLNDLYKALEALDKIDDDSIENNLGFIEKASNLAIKIGKYMDELKSIILQIEQCEASYRTPYDVWLEDRRGGQ